MAALAGPGSLSPLPATYLFLGSALMKIPPVHKDDLSNLRSVRRMVLSFQRAGVTDFECFVVNLRTLFPADFVARWFEIISNMWFEFLSEDSSS